MAALVGAEIVREDELKDGASYLDRLLKTTLWLLESDLTPVERADAGRALAKLGDPRPSVMDVDALEFSLIPAGKFYLGSKKGEGNSEEQPQHQLDMPAFWMSRYPITNAQYAVFMKARGYEDESLWGEAKKANVWKEGMVKGRWDNEPRFVPENFDEPFNLSNHPIVGITWYEMLAFTRWLDRRWHKEAFLSENWQVALPSESEWEKAARGGIQIPKAPKLKLAKKGGWEMQIDGKEFIQNPIPQRAYPWGDEFDLNKTNNRDTGIGTTCTVGCFAEGVSPYGVHDLSGNVWEWGRSLYEKYPYPESGKDLGEREDLAAGTDSLRVLRGGAFDHASNFVRCASRNGGAPHDWHNDSGFRVVVVPSSSS